MSGCAATVCTSSSTIQSGVRHPFGLRFHLAEDERSAGSRNVADFAHTDGNPAEPACRPAVVAFGIGGIARAGAQVQAARLIGTFRTHPTFRANVARRNDPYAG
jgi:hypothetical protein